MPRKNRLFIHGFPHLIQLRGHNGEAFFFDGEDFSTFELSLTQAAHRYNIAIHSYSLAAERILLLVTAEDQPALSRFVQFIGRQYVPYYNHRYQRTGALWESRFACSPLQANTHFLIVKRFIECSQDSDQKHHSDGIYPKSLIVPHHCWTQLAESEELRQARFKDFCRVPMNPVLTTQIHAALEQNSLLATPELRKRLEEQYARSLQVRQRGRPRKYITSAPNYWQELEQHAAYVLKQRGYQQIRLSYLEYESLFVDNHPKALSHIRLRGDGTTACLRLISGLPNRHALSRVWYSGTMFSQRSASQELQQKNQIGIESFGMPGIDIELEQLTLQASFFRRIGLGEHVALYVNMLGDHSALSCFRAALIDYFRPYAHLMTSEQNIQLTHRPEVLLNTDDQLLKKLTVAAPNIQSYISNASQQRFLRLQQALNVTDITWHHDTNLFPENDYCQLVFEWRSGNTVISRGGRYDSYASQIVETPIYACGFAFLVEPLIQLLSHQKIELHSPSRIDVIIIASQPRVAAQTVLLAHRLRLQFPELSIATDSSQLQMSTRHKNSRQQGARLTLELEGDGYSLRIYDELHEGYQLTNVDLIAEQLGTRLYL